MTALKASLWQGPESSCFITTTADNTEGAAHQTPQNLSVTTVGLKRCGCRLRLLDSGAHPLMERSAARAALWAKPKANDPPSAVRPEICHRSGLLPLATLRPQLRWRVV